MFLKHFNPQDTCRVTPTKLRDIINSNSRDTVGIQWDQMGWTRNNFYSVSNVF